MKVSLDSTNLPSPTIDVDIMMKKREYTRGLLLCNHRIYIQSLQVIASIADQTYKDISKECEGSLSFNNLLFLSDFLIDQTNSDNNNNDNNDNNSNPSNLLSRTKYIVLSIDKCITNWWDYTIPFIDNSQNTFPDMYRLIIFFILLC